MLQGSEIYFLSREGEDDYELSGKCYEAAVKFVEELERIKKENT